MYVSIHPSMHACMHVCMSVCMYTSMYVRIYVCLYVSQSHWCKRMIYGCTGMQLLWNTEIHWEGRRAESLREPEGRSRGLRRCVHLSMSLCSSFSASACRHVWMSPSMCLCAHGVGLALALCISYVHYVSLFGVPSDPLSIAPSDLLSGAPSETPIH